MANLFVPDRYDSFSDRQPSELKNFVVGVEDALSHFDEVFADAIAAGRGSFVILRGESGAGKSTFLNTLQIFRKDVEVVSIPNSDAIADSLKGLPPTIKTLRVLVIEGREALGETNDAEIEAGLHSINGFLRSSAGRSTIMVWPCNTDDLANRLVSKAKPLGGEALLGTGEPVFYFKGPSASLFTKIARRTVQTFNDGASLIDLGVSDFRAEELALEASTIGNYMTLIRKELSKNKKHLSQLIAKESCRMWIVVVSGNDSDTDVSSLTRGSTSNVDIERLLSSTGANIVGELRKYPQELGILGSVLDAKILHMPVLTMLAIVRSFADGRLKPKLSAADFAIENSKENARKRLGSSELAAAYLGNPLGTRARGKKIGSNSLESFKKLLKIAQTDDVAVNRALGAALIHVGLADLIQVEKDLGTGLKRRTDIYTEKDGVATRLEIMWRENSSRAEIANYTLTKLTNYGKAIEFLK